MSTTENQLHNFQLKEIRCGAPLSHPTSDGSGLQSPFTDSLDEWDVSLQPLPEDHDAAVKPRRTVPAEIDDLERELAGDEVQVTFHFSTAVMQQYDFEKRITKQDGKLPFTHRFYMGQNIEHLKFFIYQFYGLPYKNISLYIRDLMLMDPLSLSDLPFKANENNDVKVIFKE